MIGKNKGSSFVMEIYGIYYANGEKYFIGLPPENEGIVVYKANKLDILDESTENFVNIDDKNGIIAPGFYHKSLLEDNIMKRLLEFENGAVDDFRKKLKDLPHEAV